MPYDQMFRTETSPFDHTICARWPYVLFADQEWVSSSYLNNSLEGELFTPDAAYSDGSYVITDEGAYFKPDFYFYKAGGPDSATPYSIRPNTQNGLSINSSNICTIICTTSTTIAVGDIVSVTGQYWSANTPYMNGSYVVRAVDTTTNANDTISFEYNTGGVAYAATLFNSSFANRYLSKSPVFEVRDNRSTSAAKGKSFTSIIFTPKYSYYCSTAADNQRSACMDVYTRFRFQLGHDTLAQGGINSNLFNVIDESTGYNIKPVLWAYFFGYNLEDADADILQSSGNVFEVAFNSYAVILRPTGEGSRLEFAFVKFSWGTDCRDWMNSIIDNKLKQYTVSENLLGYLVSSNPDVLKTGDTPIVTELAVSDSFAYNSELPTRFNLKITVRKHLLTDSSTDNTYLVNLMVNDDYNSFGPQKHYDSILHTYITRPNPITRTVTMSATPPYPKSALLMPMFYFKFNNINDEVTGAPNIFESPIYAGSSKIILDNLILRPINAALPSLV